uniref:uncharacterized protein LOC105350438 isoform X1 n=1 Tax=Fragaria vesca subsp. vesca TaxID=101020 RepID=UPI0005CA5D60|nr:PREDICTED: uncharacterized protein LOC105350438 isoform X1 [Fragaria vesca subsp. vesca]
MKTVCITLLIFAVILIKVGGRSLQHSSSNLVSDGTDNIEAVTQTSLLVFGGTYSFEDCSLLYGLFPCSYTVLGKLFLIVGYVLLYIIGESYVAAGGELIFEVNGSVGANLFHILGAIPDAIILLVSGLTASTETAQSKVSIGVGLLVGSTVFYLTAVWGLCVYAGKCDLEGKESQDTTDTKMFSLLGSGVSTEIWTICCFSITSSSPLKFRWPRPYNFNCAHCLCDTHYSLFLLRGNWTG